MRTHIAGNTDRRVWGAAARAFTLIEAMVVMGIIALLAGIVLLAIRHVKSTGDVTAEVGMVSALRKAVEGFKQQFGFVPALVVDTGPGPVTATNQVVVWNATELADPASTVNGGNRWSQYSLAYYIVGALDQPYDGASGLGSTEPTRDGQFSKHGREIKPFMDVTTQKTRTGANRLYILNNGVGPASQRVLCVIWDRWSDGTASAATLPPPPSQSATSYPIRYYRWLPSYYPPADPKAGQVQYWNVPEVIGGNANNSLPPSKPELKSAEYAIVAPGPDHLFGDESWLTTPEERAKARQDNIMEVGK